MKKIMMAAMGLALAGAAGAQTWNTDNGQLQLQSCYRVSGGVQCDMTYMVTSQEVIDATLNPSDFGAFSTEGNKYAPRTVSLAGAVFSGALADDSVKLFKGVPVKLSMVFPGFPTNSSIMTVLSYRDFVMRNVPIRASATAPATVTTAPAQINIAGNWNATLTNCKQTTPGVVVCTATLKK